MYEGTKLYHGSNQYIEHELIPHKSFHYKPLVYATSDFLYALVRAGKFDMDKFLIKEDYMGHIFTLVEIEENAFKEVFDADGWVYIVDHKGFFQDNNCMQREYINEDNVKILDCIYIENIFEKMKEYKPIYNLIYYKDSDEYWKTVRGGKAGYLQRRKERTERLKTT